MNASYFKSETFKRIPPTARVLPSFHNSYLMMLLPFCYCGLSLPQNNKPRHTQICHTPNPIFAKRSSSCHCTRIPTHTPNHTQLIQFTLRRDYTGVQRYVRRLIKTSYYTVLTAAYDIYKRNCIQSDSPRIPICSTAFYYLVLRFFFNFNL